eukprot:scaffold36188_cov54-Attheya_sp.AAC.3
MASEDVKINAGGVVHKAKGGGTVSPTNNESKKRKRSSQKKKKITLKPGDEGYLTPTQLRNARKRRSKQAAAGKNSASDSKASDNGVVGTTQSKSIPEDPSMRYMSNPRKAPVVQRAVAFFKGHGKQFDVHMGPTEHWRTVSKLAVRSSGEDGNVAIGLFAPQSHALLRIPDCPAHHPAINAAVSAVEKACRALQIQAYDEASGEGYLRYVAINVERSTSKVQLTLIWNSNPYPTQKENADADDNKNDDAVDTGRVALEKLLAKLQKMGIQTNSDGDSSANPKKRRRGRKGKEGDAADPTDRTHPDKGHDCDVKFELHSLWVHFNAAWKHSNAIFSFQDGSWRHVYGDRCIVESLDFSASQVPPLPFPVQLHFAPNVFRQANVDSFSNIVGAIRKRVSDYTSSKQDLELPSMVELYGGVGTIGLHLVDLVRSFVSSDENPHNLACFQSSVALLPSKEQTKVSYISKNAADMVHHEKVFSSNKAEIFVVDPPRKGLEEEVCTALCTSKNTKLLVYVSCGFDAFQRDCKALLESGKWVLEHAQGHLLFPGSDAIETLAFFVRK